MGNLQLRKCAYIFDDTYTTYFYGTRDQIAQRNAIQKELKTFYDNEQRRADWLPYATWNGEQIKRYYINIRGVWHGLNALQIAAIDNDPQNIINNRRNRDFDGLQNVKNIKYQNNHWLLSDKYKSLRFECFTGLNDLGYYRVYFKKNCYKFIIDDRNGDIYTAEGITHVKTTRRAIIRHLDINSAGALEIFNTILNHLTEAKTNEL